MLYECSVCDESDGGGKCTINVPGVEKPQCCPVWNNWSAKWKIADCTEQQVQNRA